MNNEKKYNLVQWFFMSLCCVYGMFSKRLILPVANIITHALHIPGGIGTSFSLLFLAVGAWLCNVPYAGTLMGVVQGLLAMIMGMTGHMGILAPIGYILPGVMIDLCYFIIKKLKIRSLKFVPLTNGLASITAALFANIVSYRVSGIVLCLYIVVAFVSGVIFGVLAMSLLRILRPILKFE